MIEFWNRYQTKLITSSVEHIELVVLSVSLALLVCIPLVALARASKIANTIITIIVNGIYTIPSMALFGICVPLIGIGRPSAVVALMLYNLFVIFKNINIGLSSVNTSLLEAGKGIGYNPVQLFFKIQLPQMLPSLFAGLKLASTMTVGIATIASIINGGGLGRLMFDGLKRRYVGEILWATLVSVVFAAIFNGIFQLLENISLAKAQGEWKAKA